MTNVLETLKAILSQKLPDAEVQALIAELTIASGNGSVAINGDATEAIIVTGNRNIVGDNNQIIVNHGTNPDELVKMLQRVFQHNEKAAFARRTISHTMTMVFVDLMRLLYVATSDIARSANVSRYGEFIDIAKQHFADLRNHIARSSNELDAQLNELSLNLDKRISFMLGRLGRGPDLNGNSDDCFKKMKQIGKQVDGFCTTTIGEGHERVVQRIDIYFSRAIEELSIIVETAPLDDIFRLRLYVQSRLLNDGYSLDGSKIFTIADDMDQDFGIYYFALDKKILDCLSIATDIVASGDRAVAVQNAQGATIMTGDGNIGGNKNVVQSVTQKGKSNINLGSAQNLNIGDAINNDRE